MPRGRRRTRYRDHQGPVLLQRLSMPIQFGETKIDFDIPSLPSGVETKLDTANIRAGLKLAFTRLAGNLAGKLPTGVSGLNISLDVYISTAWDWTSLSEEEIRELIYFWKHTEIGRRLSYTGSTANARRFSGGVGGGAGGGSGGGTRRSGSSRRGSRSTRGSGSRAATFIDRILRSIEGQGFY